MRTLLVALSVFLWIGLNETTPRRRTLTGRGEGSHAFGTNPGLRPKGWPSVRRPLPVQPPAATTMHPQQREPGPVLTRKAVIPSDPVEARRVQEDIEQLLRDSLCHDHDLF